MSRASAAVGPVSSSVHEANGTIAGIRQNEDQVGEEAVEQLGSKLHDGTPGKPPHRASSSCAAHGPTA